MRPRLLTSGEKALLRPIFGPTLPYDGQQISKNYREWGGATNSITPGPIPWMAPTIWAEDYSASGVPEEDRGIFVHEMTHVWQWYHGENNILNAVKTGIWYEVLAPIDFKALMQAAKCKCSVKITTRSYDDVYYYNLYYSNNLTSYNFEAQAAIVEDYYRLSKGLPAQHNKGSKRALSDYEPFIAQVRASGPPRSFRPNPNKDWVGNKI